MNVEFIATLANRHVRIQFLAMERSLRSTGCDLPLRVIPFDDDRFDLPTGSDWWEMPAVSAWIESGRASRLAKGMMRKYQCLLAANYQFVDSDVIFLRDPREALAEPQGFVVACGHWHNPEHTYTAKTRAWYRKSTTVWQSRVFNAGQFAADRILYDLDTLMRVGGGVELSDACMHNQFHDQPGLNALVFATNVPVINLTMPPRCMESTWAGDYTRADYRSYWTDHTRMPYLIHWAGRKPDGRLPIDELFLNHLTAGEQEEWSRRTTHLSLRQRLGARLKRFSKNVFGKAPL